MEEEKKENSIWNPPNVYSVRYIEETSNSSGPVDDGGGSTLES